MLMPRVLLVGLDPAAVDFSDPDLPPGMTEERIAAGIATALDTMRSRGWQVAFCSLHQNDSAEATLAASLKAGWDCVVVGGGIRVPRRNLVFFEQVVNAIHRGAPGVPIAFNTSPENTVEAAARWLPEQDPTVT